MASTVSANDESKCGHGRIQGKVAIVTGGAQGIGAAIVRRFVEEGALVAIFDVAELQGAALSKELGTCTQFFKVDMSSEDAVKANVSAVTAWSGGRLDILVNNAAAFVFGEVEDVTSDQWDRVLGVNVKGYAYAMKHTFPVFKATGGGAVVNLASISSFIAQPAFVPYSTTKGAILQMTRCTAMDGGKHGIRVNAVCPGPILTEATEKHAASEGKTVDALVEEMSSQLIVKRMGSPKEVANAVLFLSSDEASYITGTPLMVDGGYCTL